MHDPFELPVTYKGKEHLFPAQLFITGYTHRFVVQLPESEVIIERDEEGAYRALVQTEDPKERDRIDKNLLQAMVESVEQMIK